MLESVLASLALWNNIECWGIKWGGDFVTRKTMWLLRLRPPSIVFSCLCCAGSLGVCYCSVASWDWTCSIVNALTDQLPEAPCGLPNRGGAVLDIWLNDAHKLPAEQSRPLSPISPSPQPTLCHFPPISVPTQLKTTVVLTVTKPKVNLVA